MARLLTGLVSKLSSRIKGSDFIVDERIRSTYLVLVLVDRAFMTVRGAVRFPLRRTRPFLGAGARVRAGGDLLVESGVTLGAHSYIDALSSDGVRIGRGSSVGRNTRIECTGSLRSLGKGMSVGRNVGLGTDNFFGCAGGIRIGDDTIIGNFVSFHAENHRFNDESVPIRMQSVTRAGISVGKDCWIGAKSTVLDGVELGSNSIVAAGSVLVAGEYASGGIYGGVPAKLIRRR